MRRDHDPSPCREMCVVSGDFLPRFLYRFLRVIYVLLY